MKHKILTLERLLRLNNIKHWMLQTDADSFSLLVQISIIFGNVLFMSLPQLPRENSDIFICKSSDLKKLEPQNILLLITNAKKLTKTSADYCSLDLQDTLHPSLCAFAKLPSHRPAQLMPSMLLSDGSNHAQTAIITAERIMNVEQSRATAVWFRKGNAATVGKIRTQQV